MFNLDPDLNVIREIVSDSPYGDWYTPEARNEFLHCLGRVMAMKGEFDSHTNALIYSYWKAEKSQRVMAKAKPDDMAEKSMENAWRILGEVNLGDLRLSEEFVQYVKTNADVI